MNGDGRRVRNEGSTRGGGGVRGEYGGMRDEV